MSGPALAIREAGVNFPELAVEIIEDLTEGHSAAVTGLSNTGKSTLMRALAGDEVRALYAELQGRNGHLIYIDCNRAVAISAQAFYEIVLRSILEGIEADLPADLAQSVRAHHQAITEANQAFGASLSFNLALTELGEGSGSDLILLIDEFDEIYAELEDRALVNMRALRDRFGEQLSYVIATVRGLTQLRGREVEGEFAEMFSRSSYRMPKLSEAEAASLLTSAAVPPLSDEGRKRCLRLAGGHPGLLIATAQALQSMAPGGEGELERRALQAPQPGAECMKIWSQLTEDEKTHLGALALGPEASLPTPHMNRLERLGLVRHGQLFSPIFDRFVKRRMRAPEVRDLGIYVDEDSGDVWVDGVRIPVLTELEFRLMQLLDERRDKLTDKFTIVTRVWGEEYLADVDDARVEKLISRLRAKIEPDPGEPRYLITRRGRGYKLLSRPRSPD